jgi:hypothetical protein
MASKMTTGIGPGALMENSTNLSNFSKKMRSAGRENSDETLKDSLTKRSD